MKHVLIIGATSEIAQAIASKYAMEGWELTLAAVENDMLCEVAKNIASISKKPVKTKRFDALDFDSHPDFYHSLPNKPCEVICAFGYMGDQETARSDLSEVQKTIHINLTGMVSILNIVAEDFQQRGSGNIAALSSVAGERGKQGNYIYGCAKAALTAYLSGLRNRLSRHGVNVMTVLPGFCRTSKIKAEGVPACLVADPAEVADAVYVGLRKVRSVVYVRPSWRWIMWLVRHMPEFMFQRLAYTRFHY